VGQNRGKVGTKQQNVLAGGERAGFASIYVTAVEVDIDTLAERLAQEALANRATLVAPPFIGAWAQIA